MAYAKRPNTAIRLGTVGVSAARGLTPAWHLGSQQSSHHSLLEGCRDGSERAQARCGAGALYWRVLAEGVGTVEACRQVGSAELAAAALDGDDEPTVRSPRGSRIIPPRQRLAAVAILGDREEHLSTTQCLALVDAAAWWLSEPNGGEEFAYALLAASCATEITTESVCLT